VLRWCTHDVHGHEQALGELKRWRGDRNYHQAIQPGSPPHTHRLPHRRQYPRASRERHTRAQRVEEKVMDLHRRR
jgi:hypothetical protein